MTLRKRRLLPPSLGEVTSLSQAKQHKTTHTVVSIAAIAAILLVIAANVVIVRGNKNKLVRTAQPDSGVTSTVTDTVQTPVTQTDLSTAAASEPVSSEPVSSEPIVSDADLIYPKYPYFIEVDKTHQIVTVYTTSSAGKYDKVVRHMLCSTAQDPDKFPDGYWKLKEDRCTSKNVWRKMKSHGTDLYAQYATQITGDFLFHSVPYTAKKKTTLDTKRYSKLGTADSGGCIRLTVENAKWICENCVAGTTVHLITKKEDPDLLDLAAQLKANTIKPDSTGWDPTDPDPKNPNYHPQYTEPDPVTEGYLVENFDKIKYSKEIPYVS